MCCGMHILEKISPPATVNGIDSVWIWDANALLQQQKPQPTCKESKIQCKVGRHTKGLEKFLTWVNLKKKKKSIFQH